MPFLNNRTPSYKPQKEFDINWDKFNGGWNNIFKPTELKPNELSQADNMMLVGEGVPSGRWGSVEDFLAGVGMPRFLGTYNKSQVSQNDLLAITDAGYLVKKSGASYTIITGASFPSGIDVTATQLGGNLYMAGGPSRTFVKYDGTNILPYDPISTPTGVAVSNLSGASGFTTWSWRVAANSIVGETLASTPVSLATLPLDLTSALIRLSWSPVSAASGTLKSYSIYRGNPGAETLLGVVDYNTTTYLDNGQTASDVIFPRTSDTTAGPRARYLAKLDDRIVLSGFDDDPSRVDISARYPYQDRFHWADGGGFTYVDPDGGENVSAVGVVNSQGTDYQAASILIFKPNSVHRVVLSLAQIGNFAVLDPQVQTLTTSNGCSSHKSVVQVENDVFYFGRKGLYTIGQEPNFLNQIRTNELSARIRNYVRGLTDADFKNATAAYIDNKYILSFPDRQETVIYDRERLAFMGPWKTPWGITHWLKYLDTSGNENWLAATDEGPYIRKFSDSIIDDSGTAVSKILRTKKEEITTWSSLKIIKLLYVLFRSVRGQVTVNIRLETKDGNLVTTKSFNITSALGTGGWGSDQYGTQSYGQTEATVSLTGEELVRWTQLYKIARVIQIEVQSTSANTNFEFLGTRFTAQDLGPQSLPATTRV